MKREKIDKVKHKPKKMMNFHNNYKNNIRLIYLKLISFIMHDI